MLEHLNLLFTSYHPLGLGQLFPKFLAYSPRYIVKMDLNLVVSYCHASFRPSDHSAFSLRTHPAVRTRSLASFIQLLKIHVKEKSNTNTVQALIVEFLKL